MNKHYLFRNVIILLIISSISITGCWSMKELNNLAIILATGIDRNNDGKILLTVQIARPSAFGGAGGKTAGYQENNVWVISETGDTVLDARKKLEQKVPRRVYWGHNSVLVVGKEMAQQDIRQAIDFFTRSTIVRETMWVVTARGKASELLNSHSQLETSSAQSVDKMIKSGVGVQLNLKDLSMTLASDGNPVLPAMELTPSGVPQGPGLEENLPEVKQGEQKQTMVHGEITITGSAVYKGEKLIGWLNMMETRGLLWLKKQIKRGFVTIPSIGDTDEKVTVRVTESSTNVEPYYDGEDIWIDVTIETEGDVLEHQSTVDLTKPENIYALDRKLSNEIKQSMLDVLNKAQDEYRVDIFGFGDIFHRKYVKDWVKIKNQWDDKFANAQVNITVKSDIRRSGLITK